MSLYDKASLIFSGAAGAGTKDVAYNIKPVEKLKVDEYIKNGNFDDDSSWTKINAPTFSNGQVRFQDSGSTVQKINQSGVFEVGKTYRVSINVVEIKEGRIKIGNGFNSIEITANENPISTPGYHSFYYTAREGNDDDMIVIQRHDVGDPYDFTIDNVSVREVEQKANDFSFVRASDLTATYEGPDGLIKKTRENLIEYSNDFSKWSNASGLYGYTLTSSQSGYDGSTNATLVDKTTTDHNGYIYNTATTISHNGVFTYSIYARDGGDDNSSIHIYIGDNSPKGNIRVNLNTGALLNSTAIATKIEPITGKAGDTDRWYRISFTNDANLNDKPRIQVRNAAGDQNSAGKMFIQNAQVEVGLVPTPYIHRTDSYSKSTAGIQEDEPRYDYSLDNDAPPALLYEPERINLVDYSEAFLGDDWIKSSNYTVANNAATSPEGVDNAVKCTIPNANGQLRFRSAVDANTDYVWSFYVKRGTATQLKYSVYDNTNAANIVAQTSYYSDTSSSEWKRIEVPFTTPAGCSSVGVYPDRDSQGNGTVFFWGFQLEKGSCVTSYIPTYGSAGTRYRETIPQYTPSKTNLDKYTFFAHSHSDRVAADNRAPRLIGDGNSSIMGIFVNASGKKQFFLRDNENNSVLSKHTFDSFTADDDTKYAFVVDNIALEAKLFIDGVLRETMSLTERVDAKIVSVSGSDGNPDRIKSIMYFPEALEDGDVVSLTT